MGILRNIFGPSQEEMWRQLSAEVNGCFDAGGFWGTQNVQAEVGDWIITLDTYTVSTGKTTITYTRMRAPFVNRDNVRFTVSRAGFLTPLGKLLGVQDLEIGDAQFDKEFVIQANSAERIRELLADAALRELIRSQDQVLFTVRDDEGWLEGRYPEGVDQICFTITGVVKDVARLRRLYDLFAGVLNRLQHLDSGHLDDVSLHLDTLAGPTGRIQAGKLTMWDSTPARLRAARALGDQTEPRCRDALLQALQDAEPAVRATAIEALGRHGDPTLAEALIPFLGAGAAETDPEPLAAAGALGRLGLGAEADAFNRTLKGEFPQHLPRLDGERRAAYCRAFIRSLEARPAPPASTAALALAEWSVVEALAPIREALRRLRPEEPGHRDAFDRAISELERRSTLPRPSEAAAADTGSLPVVKDD